jgi:CRISPR/Cas system-associated endonuclease Cas1
MRTFHTGGVASTSDITQGLPRVQELFEARNPKGKARISEVNGKVEDIITQKIENQQALISMINTEEISQKRYKEKSIARLQEYIDKIKSLEGALIKAGIDPYIGVLHRDEYNRPVLAYDVIERYRIWIDFIVYHLLQQQIITDEFYSKHEDGSFWLESLGRRVIIQMVNDYLEENITINGLSRSRATHLQLYAQDLAQQFKLSKL